MAKQLSLPERYVIERMLHQDYSFASIGRKGLISVIEAGSQLLLQTDWHAAY